MFDWKELLKYRFMALAVSLTVIVTCLLGVAYRGGLIYGIDFTGGLRVLFEFDQEITTSKMQNMRQLFHQKLDEARLSTVSLHGEEKRRGLLVTVQGNQLVDRLTQRLYSYGRQGGNSDFSDFQLTGAASILGREILVENFRVGGAEAERIKKVDLSRAPRDEINSRVQTIINSKLSQRIVTMLRDNLLGTKNKKIDLNWADADEIQTWLMNQQLNGLVDSLFQRRSSDGLNSFQGLAPLLEKFGIPLDRFRQIFTLSDEDDNKLNLNEIDRSGFREIVNEEFFTDRYREISKRLVQKRSDAGLYRSMRHVMSLDFMEALHKPSLRGSAALSPFVKVRSEMISPSIGADYISLAALAILISLVGILLYLSVRFQFRYSIGAIGAILHDIIVTVGLLTLFGIAFDISVVAAVLTVIGYSLNDTIVNFDRVRENRMLMGGGSDWYDVINRSVYEVLNRTIVTSVSTFLAAIVLYFGGVALQAFAITLIIGIGTGTFSSIFVSNVILFQLQKS